MSQVEVSIEQTTGEDRVSLELPPSITITEEGTLQFKSMDDLAAFSDAVLGLVNGWRADVEYGKLTGIRKSIADAILQQMREQVSQGYSAEAAERFPEDILFGSQWFVDLEIHEDSNRLQINIEQHVKALILSLANAFATAREASKDDHSGGSQ